MKNLLLTFAFTALFTLVSCEQTKKVIDTASSVQLNGTYNITMLDGENYSAKDLELRFNALDTSFSATTDCNNLFGQYTIDVYTIEFDQIASTKKMCEGKMQTEETMYDALSNVGSFELTDDKLTLLSKNDRSILVSAKKEKNNNDD